MKSSIARPSRASWDRSSLVASGVETALAVTLVATFLSQHPNRIFDRLRHMKFTGSLIPNWRFFAPTPARHDFHILYRTLTTSDKQSEWKQASFITPRSWSHAVWFPNRRAEKATFDVCQNLLTLGGNAVEATERVEFALLRELVLHHIKENDPVWPQLAGFQVLIVRYSGYDTSESPEYLLASPLIKVPEEIGKA